MVPAPGLWAPRENLKLGLRMTRVTGRDVGLAEVVHVLVVAGVNAQDNPRSWAWKSPEPKMVPDGPTFVPDQGHPRFGGVALVSGDGH
jgi:hypothetical protein